VSDDLTNIRDLMSADDAMDLEDRFDRAIREHNEYEAEIDAIYLGLTRGEPFDWERDLPEDYFWYD